MPLEQDGDMWQFNQRLLTVTVHDVARSCPQSGALEVRVHSTGYILSTFYRPQEAPYGFRLAENINGNIHHHMFHFKADIDILGTSNRYETLDISTETVNLRQVSMVEEYKQFYRSVCSTQAGECL